MWPGAWCTNYTLYPLQLIVVFVQLVFQLFSPPLDQSLLLLYNLGLYLQFFLHHGNLLLKADTQWRWRWLYQVSRYFLEQWMRHTISTAYGLWVTFLSVSPFVGWSSRCRPIKYSWSFFAASIKSLACLSTSTVSHKTNTFQHLLM